DVVLILFVGRLSSEKRPLLAAEILRDLVKRNIRFQALFAGDGEQRRALRRFVRHNRLDSVIRLLGNVSHSRIQELFGAADLVLLPSEREGIAVTLFEAIAAGVVPVAAAVGGQAEVITPQVGKLIAPRPDERQAYVDALATLIENPDTRHTMAAAGRKHAQAFTTAAFIGRTQSLLEAAAQRRHIQPRPPVPAGAGLAAATLALEHDQLERRLRRFVAVRAALAWRWTPFGRAVSRLAMSRSALSRLDRRIYAGRRTIGETMRRLLGKARAQKKTLRT
ncbi:MAG TPA: glycosyltransferase, partial [Roseiflexaceae bacterium]|nr:glycosyltransferase [Roseiflexaceae bacterium]